MLKHRIFTTILFGFLVGVLAASIFALSQVVVWGTVFVGACCLFSLRPRILFAGWLLLAAAVGVWRTATVLNRPSDLAALAANKTVVSLDGYVDDDFALTSTGGAYTFHVVNPDERVRVSGPDWIRPRYGQFITIHGKLQLPKNSGDFDYIAYLRKDGIHTLMYFPQYSVPDSVVLPWRTRAWIAANRFLRSVRDRLAESMAQAVPSPESGFLAGIIFGLRSDIAPALSQLFAATGTSHILAISGYNITIVASVLAAAMARLGRRRAYWFTITGIVAFTLMVGAGPSVVRAAVMGLLALTARQVGRRQGSGAAILLAGAGMAAVNPLLVRWDIGFQLSFLALIGIVYLEPLLMPVLKRLLRFDTLAAMTATTVAANILVLPLILYDFGTLAVYTLPANLLVLPLVPTAMALGFVTAVVGLAVPFLGALVGQTAWLVAAVQLALIRFFAALPYATLSVHLSVAALVAIYAVLATWLILQYRRSNG